MIFLFILIFILFLFFLGTCPGGDLNVPLDASASPVIASSCLLCESILGP
jgi:hypothetical protein